MKKILMTLLTVLITVIFIIAMKSGIKIFNVPGFQGIADENQELLNVIEQSKEKNNEYSETIKKIDADSVELATAKKDYFDLVQVSTASEIQEAMQIKSYKIEYLWSRIGNLATKEGVKVKMEITSSSVGGSAYKNLKFTINGSYLAITNFVYDLENDESLDFTIDNFDMKSDEATFTVKDVKIIEETTNSSISSNQQTSNTSSDTSNNSALNYTEEEKEKTNERTNAVVNAFSKSE